MKYIPERIIHNNVGVAGVDFGRKDCEGHL